MSSTDPIRAEAQRYDSSHRKLNVLMLSEDFPPAIGGMAQHVASLSSALAANGHNVFLIAAGYSPEDMRPPPQDTGLDLFRVPYRSSRGRIRHKSRHVFFALEGGDQVRKAAALQPDVIHWHGMWSDSYLARIAHKHASSAALIFTNHSSLFLQLVGRRSGRSLLRLVIPRPDIAIGTSREMASAFQKVRPRVPATFIPNGVDPATFSNRISKVGAREALGLPTTPVIATCPRRLCHKNGVQYLVSACQYLPSDGSLLVLVVGDGEMREMLHRQALELGVEDRVRFLGSQPYTEMPIVYAASDIVVLPSLLEATSLAALEALASGCAVVATRVGGLMDLFASGGAHLVPPADAPALARAILSVARDGEHRQQLRVAGARIVEHHTWQHIAHRTESVYVHALGL